MDPDSTPAARFSALWETEEQPPDVFAFLQQVTVATTSLSEQDILAVLLTDQRFRWKTDSPISVEQYIRNLTPLEANRSVRLQLALGEYQARLDSAIPTALDEFTKRFSDLGQSFRDQLQGSPISEAQTRYLQVQRSSETHLADRADLAETSAETLSINVGSQMPRLGRYQLINLIGKGAFGRVYLASDDELQRSVAIKVPTKERFETADDADVYLTEARTVARLNHPHIVPVHDVGKTDEGAIYVVSRFIDGCTLSQRIAKARPDFAESASLLAKIAQALQYAHDHQVIHCDVKPENILLEWNTDTPFLTDFGLAFRHHTFQQPGRTAGTPAYMSPEQARGEMHRLDGRSDIFALGVVLYVLLTGKRPFAGQTTTELLHKVANAAVIPPTEINSEIPGELERICLKALNKRLSDRYSRAEEMANDLLHWNDAPAAAGSKQQITPRGLRSFTADDADSFLDLLPGIRNRNGLPESIQFWKTRVEETDSERTFSVGLLYGPSGCGKSSLVKAGLLPQLSPLVSTIYVEATPDETEKRVLRGLHKAIPELPQNLDLQQTFSHLRQTPGNKVLVIIDQFEQWLQTHHGPTDYELVNAIRQCDGGQLQSIVMVRDDFGMAAARFMDALDIPIVQGQNYATVDLFDTDHATQVLLRFGQAFGRLPAVAADLTEQQQSFLRDAVAGLAVDGKVVCVQLSLFAEMIKGRPWLPGTLETVGGAAGLGVNFLEDTFSSRTANPGHRQHEYASREILKALLPAPGSDIKGHMKSYEQLQIASGYQKQATAFAQVLRILDGELRLITPADPDTAPAESEAGAHNERTYQLTHDYLVPSLRDWLTRKQRETFRGRAQLKLEERAGLWHVRPENRHLPSIPEWAGIRTLTEKQTWTAPQQKMMRKADRVIGLRLALLLTGLLIVMLTAAGIRSSVLQNQQRLADQKEQERRNAEASRIVDALLSAETSQISGIINNQLVIFEREAAEHLRAGFAESPAESTARLHAALALLPSDTSVLEFLEERLLSVTAMQFEHVRDLMIAQKEQLIPAYWQTIRVSEDPETRFQAACVLASYDAENEAWQQADLQTFIADHLTAVQPSELLPWRNALRPVQQHLTSALAAIYRNSAAGEQVRSFATDTLVDYWKDHPEGLFELILDADERQFPVVFNRLNLHREQAVLLGVSAITETPADGISDAQTELRTIRHANAAVMLLRMDAADRVWPLLSQSSDPRIRSYIIHWLSQRGGDPAAVTARYSTETDVTIRRALLLSLGEFSLSDAERQPLIAELLQVYGSDPDRGVHAAAAWLLRQWNQGSQLAALDEALKQNEAELLADDDRQRQWYINTQGQTFAIIEPGEFLMGSPPTEAGRLPGERQHQRTINSRIAISTTEVTRKQWRRFSQSSGALSADHPQIMLHSRTDDSPMGSMHWYEAAQYCNWLSEQEGIPESQWCYQPNEQDEFGPGMSVRGDFLQLTGYRLPTEAEWEYACRAETRSSRCYGSTEALLSRYAWYSIAGNIDKRLHPVAGLKPNDFGLFDMHGSVWEWCFDAEQDYPMLQNTNETTQQSALAAIRITNDQSRRLRGGSLFDPAELIRSAYRNSDQADYQSINYGLRPVRTFPTAD